MRKMFLKLLRISVFSSFLAASTLLLSQGTYINFFKKVEDKDPLLTLSEELAPYFAVDGTDFEKSSNPAEAIKTFLEKGGKLAAIFTFDTGDELLFIFEKDKITLSDGETRSTYTIKGEFVSSEEI